MEYENEVKYVEIVYRDLDGWECIETCIAGTQRFWDLLENGGEIIP